jgi:hypothetical protein
MQLMVNESFLLTWTRCAAAVPRRVARIRIAAAAHTTVRRLRRARQLEVACYRRIADCIVACATRVTCCI